MFNIPQKIEYVINTLIKNGYEAYIVGGCVRDMLMGKKPHDFDVTTSAEPEIVISLFEKTIPTGIKHGTVTVVIENEPIEVTTFRTENGYNDSRHPENVEFVKNLREDLSRRDFTVNAMAYNKQTLLCDYFGGKEDIENGILRTVGTPEERFKEDALRILRLFRFASTLGFEIEQNTLKSAISLANNLQKISRERIAEEIKKAVTGENIVVFTPLIENGGLEFLSIIKTPDCKIIKKLKNRNLKLFAFLWFASSNFLKTADELKLSNKEKAYFRNMEYLCNSEIPESNTQIKRLISKTSVEEISDYLEFLNAKGKNTDSLYKNLEKIIENNEPFLISHLEIDGKDLMELGFQGEKIGEILQRLLETVILEPSFNTKENLINLVKDFN